METPPWKQFHGGEENRGYIPVRSKPELKAKWNKPVNIGYISYSSPVIADDGTIYIGTTVGALVAVKADGSGIKWVHHTSPVLTNPTIIGSPAVGSKGDIYFIVSRLAGKPCNGCVDSYPSLLIKLDPVDGHETGSFEFNQPPKEVGFSYTTTSPKLITIKGEDFIFVPSKDKVFVLDSRCTVIAQSDILCTGDKGGSWPFDFESLSRNSGAQGGPHFFDTYKEPDEFWLDATPAITKNTDGGELSNPVLVTATNRCGIQAFSWTPPPNSKLESKWYIEKDFDELFSSPAISTSGEIVVGTKSGKLYSYKLQTGDENWSFNADEPLVTSPAFYGGVLRVYIAGLRNLYAIENGNQVAKFPLPFSTTSSCALSMDRVFVSTLSSLISLNIDFSSQANQSFMGGLSSPAIGKDGTVYVASNRGLLMAFEGP